MAKPGPDLNGAQNKTSELKTELSKLVKAIVDQKDNLQQNTLIQKAFIALNSLKISNNSNNNNHTNFPDEFLCPLSKQLMRDPVIISTGQTYDRPFIERWLKSGQRTCPRTQHVLSHTLLIPNLLIRELITQWCKDHGISLPDLIQCLNEDGLTEADRNHFSSLIEKMSSRLPKQKEAAKELRLLTKKFPSFRALFGESPDKIHQLLNPLLHAESLGEIQPDLQEDLITTLLNISIHDSNKKVVAESAVVVPVLIKALKSGTIQTKSNAAATLFTLSALDSNKALIGKSGALKPLIDLIEGGDLLAMKDVTSAIFNLCIYHENKGRAVRDGSVSIILKKIINRVCVDELLAILAILSNNTRAIEEMVDIGAVACLLRVMRESDCARNKENCISILYTICHGDRTKWKDMREEENNYGTISQLAKNGTSRAKRKASGILEKLNRAANFPHST